MSRVRNKEINRRRQRKARMAQLKAALAAAKNNEQRNYIIERIQRRDPFFKPE